MVCCTTVETGSVKIVERCGRFSGILTPGLSFMVPCFDVPTNPLSMRLQQIEVACETKTKDNVFTHMKVRAARESPTPIPPPPTPPPLILPPARRTGLHPVPDC